MTMIAKIYDSYYDPDTDPQLIVALNKYTAQTFEKFMQYIPAN
jgi:hypothetical protein